MSLCRTLPENGMSSANQLHRRALCPAALTSQQHIISSNPQRPERRMVASGLKFSL